MNSFSSSLSEIGHLASDTWLVCAAQLVNCALTANMDFLLSILGKAVLQFALERGRARPMQGKPIIRVARADQVAILGGSVRGHAFLLRAADSSSTAQPVRHKKARQKTRAGDGTRTRDILLGRQTLYQLSYARKTP
jgi:hypothetical protein